MALVKKSKIARGPTKAAPPSAAPKPVASLTKTADSGRKDFNTPPRHCFRTASRPQPRSFASGLTQAAAATKQLGRSMEQIAAGAEEAAVGIAGAVGFDQKRDRCQFDRRAGAKPMCPAGAPNRSARRWRRRPRKISTSVRAIERSAQRQTESAALIGEARPCRAGRYVGEITRVVSRISGIRRISWL